MSNPQDQSYRIVHVFVPFAAAYFLSYVTRSVNAVLSGELTQDLLLSASQLGLLSSAYFLTFAAMQIPLGALLDRHGPKRIEAGLLLFAVAGCLVSGLAESFVVLWIGRAMIGIGVSACLMASYKAYRLCFRADQQSSLASLMLMVGSFGALAATVPIEFALPHVGWRGVFLITAGLFVFSLIALVMLLPAMPEPPHHPHPFWRDTMKGAKEVFSHREIQRLIPFSIFTHGGFIAVQSLWMGPWFRIVDMQSSGQAATSLLILGVVVMCSHLTMSALGTQFKRWGWSYDTILGIGCAAMLAASAAAIFNIWNASLFGWSLMFALTAVTAVSYAKASLSFPAAMAGRANTGINFIVFVGAFGLQWGLGLIIDAVVALGRPQADGILVAFIFWLLTQAFAMIWYVKLPARPDHLTEHP